MCRPDAAAPVHRAINVGRQGSATATQVHQDRASCPSSRVRSFYPRRQPWHQRHRRHGQGRGHSCLAPHPALEPARTLAWPRNALKG